MSHEIERKFLVIWPLEKILKVTPCLRRIEIEQRYLDNCGDWSTRIRKSVCNGFADFKLCLKKKITTRKRVEMETPVLEPFYNMMATQCGPALTKVRHEVRYNGHLWEIDVFDHPALDGLVLAEIELTEEDDLFDLPPWVGIEVTEDKKFRNGKLAKRLVERQDAA